MTAFLKSFQTHFSENFSDLFDVDSKNRYYLFYGNPSVWGSPDNPPALVDCVDSDLRARRSMIAAKRITPNDVSFVIDRVNWTTGTVYTPYRTNANVFASSFYVLVDDKRVYKCIDNNSGATSTAKPVGTSALIETTADGYRWKYMYSVSENRRKFLTTEYIPVETIPESASIDPTDERYLQWNVLNSAKRGSIDFVVTNATGSSAYPQCVQYNVGNLIVALSGGNLNITLQSTSSSTNGAYVGYSLVLSDGQTRKITAYVGSTKVATIEKVFDTTPTAGVTTYSIRPTVEVTGDGNYARLRAVIDGTNKISGVEVIDSGFGYSTATAVVSPALDLSSNVLTPPTFTFQIAPEEGHGSDPVRELGASKVMSFVSITGTENGVIPASNDYRIFGILANPVTQTNVLAGEQLLTPVRVLTLKAYSDKLFYTETPNDVSFTANDLIFGETTGSSGEVYKYDIVDTQDQLKKQKYATLLLKKSKGRFQESSKVNETIKLTFSDSYTSGNDFKVGTKCYVCPNSSSNPVSTSVTVARVVSWNSTSKELVVDSVTGAPFAVNSNVVCPVTRSFSGINGYTISAIVTNYSTENGEYITRVKKGSLAGTPSTSTDSTVNLQRGQVVSSYDKLVDTALADSLAVDQIVNREFTKSETYSLTTDVTFKKGATSALTTSTFANDLVVTGITTGSTGILVSCTLTPDNVTPTGGTFRLVNVIGDFAKGEALKIAGTTTDHYIDNTISTPIKQPDLKFGSGKVLYIQNTRPIARDVEQRDEFRIVFGFNATS